MDDQALIRALQAGERAALRRTMEVYAGYTSAVLGNTLRGQASREDLEELLSDVFLSLWRSREGLDPDKSLKSWLAAVARNRAVDFLRRKRETHPVPDGLPDPAPGPEEQAERREAEERLRALVEDMEEPDPDEIEFVKVDEKGFFLGDMIVIPQPVSDEAAGKESVLVIEYLQHTSDDTPLTQTYVCPLDSVTENGRWEMGKHYIYDIVFALHKITVEPDVLEWEERPGSATVN